MAKDPIQKALASPLGGIIKSSIIASVDIHRSKEIAKEKILQKGIIQSNIERILVGKREMLARLSDKRKDLIEKANDKLDDAMKKLKEEVAVIIKEMTREIENIEKLTEKYIAPLSEGIEKAIDPIRGEMQTILKDMLATPKIEQSYRSVAKEIGFDIDGYVHDESRKVDFIELVREPDVELDDFNMLSTFLQINSDNPAYSGLSDFVQQLKSTPSNGDKIERFMAGFAGTELLETARAKLEEAQKAALDVYADLGMDRDLSDVEDEIMSCQRSLQSGIHKLNNMELNCRVAGDNIMRTFSMKETQTFVKIEVEMSDELEHSEKQGLSNESASSLKF